MHTMRLSGKARGWQKVQYEVCRLRMLQAVLARRLVVGEVYDIMGRVQALLVRAHAAAVRLVASAVRVPSRKIPRLSHKSSQSIRASFLSNETGCCALFVTTPVDSMKTACRQCCAARCFPH